MHFTNAIVLGAAVASAKQTFRVDVGKDGLKYTPANTAAQVGDDIEFHYYPMNHTVTQSSFAKPCVPLDGGFFSGFVPTQADNAGLSTFTITVKDMKPIWFYCSQTKPASHCQKGMVGSINAPSVGNTLEAFGALAANTTVTLAPPGGACLYCHHFRGHQH
ncbi:hypothetical protein NQ176_g10056 [Zarea fungicola]|uniref:Uncharacterized protein n=1 Tax=Zarea fungicola TaxID=93591 RepID=A0ACC1MI80_9HYPO|nr:hypothetical protein NQ176_g10056 [Lecanicillium fungicola]